MKRLFALILLIALLPLCGLAHQRGFGEYAMDQVNVRRSPGGDILFKKQRGEELFILSWREEKGHTWYQVNTYDERRVKPVTGWVRGDMVLGPEQLFSDVVQVAADFNSMIALKKDGTAVMGGERHKNPHLMRGALPASWQGVKKVAAGFLTVYGLREDGSLYQWGLRGPNNGLPGVLDAQGNNVRFADIDAFYDTFLGLMENGALYSISESQHVRQVMPPGSGITGFSAGSNFYDDALFLQDGKLTSMSIFYESYLTQEQRQTLSGWQDIVKVEAGIRSPFREGGAWKEKAEPIVAGIRRDGGVIALNPTMNQEVSSWQEIRDIAAGDGFIVGLSKDGRVMAAGERKGLVAGDLAAWTDIVNIACGETFCVGLTRDGQVLFAGEVKFSHN